MSQSPTNYHRPLMAVWTDGRIFFVYPPQNDFVPVLPTTPTVGLTDELAAGDHQGRPASDHVDEASLYFDFDLDPGLDHAPPAATVLTTPPIYVRLQASPQEISPPSQPLGAGERPTTQVARRNWRSRRTLRPKVTRQHACAPCDKFFERIQELNRHRRDVHGPQHECPLAHCTFQWTRPNKIKRHFKSCHWDQLAFANLLDEFEPLRGKKIIEFLDTYFGGHDGFEVGTTSDIAPFDFSQDVSAYLA